MDAANRMKERLFSLDMLRGLDMILLTVVGLVLEAFARTVAQGALPHVAKDAQPFLIEVLIVLGTVLAMVFWRQYKKMK